jgi:ABC-type multidrug transport system ATPase subunit
MIFLDEPTTGLDSSTAFSVIELLKHLSRHGVNVVSTIHQPSSEIFALFHKLLLLVRGNIIYHGDAQTATDYLDKHGFPLPPYSNPSDFFMKLMNEEGLMIEKLQRGEELPPDTEIE